MSDDDELERGLGKDAYGALQGWGVQKGLTYRLDRWFVNGKTSAKVAVVDEHDSFRGSTRKLVLKLDEMRSTDLSNSEYARQYRATWQATDFAGRHLAELIGDPVAAGGSRWITFHGLAGGNLGDYDVVSSLLDGFLRPGPEHCGAERFAEVFRQIVRGVLAEWAGAPRVAYLTVPSFLERHLGDRLAPGSPLDVLAKSMSGRHVDLPGESGTLVNPFALLRDASLAPGIVVSAPVGRAHADLHIDNALVRVYPEVDPSDFYLVDLAKYEDEGVLSRDPVHLVVNLARRVLEDLASAARQDALMDVLLHPASASSELLPPWLSQAIVETERCAEEWVTPSGFAPDWRKQRLLSILACALMVRVRPSTPVEHHDWFLRLAARSATAFLGPGALSMGGSDPPEEALDPPAVRSPRHSDSGSERSSATQRTLIVGRAAEETAFDALVARGSAYSLLNIYGPGGIGKTEVYAKLIRHARGRGVAVGAADVSVHKASSAKILAALTATLLETVPEDAAEQFRTLAGRLDEYRTVADLLGRLGGIDALFETRGTVRDEAVLSELLDGADASLSGQLRRELRNRFALDRYLRTTPGRLTDGFLDAVGGATDDGRFPVALLLDTYEEIGALDDWVCHQLVPGLPEHARIVILGRNLLTHENFDWVDHGDAVRGRALPELAEDEAKAYLRHYGLTDPASLADIYQFTGGYPLLLVLVRQLASEVGGWAAVGRLDSDGDRDRIASRLLDRILKEQRVREVREVLEKCAIAAWINPEIIQTLLGVGDDDARAMFEKVRRHSFMERHPDGVRPHEKIRALLSDRLRFTSESEYLRLTAKLSAYHAEKSKNLGRRGPADE